MWEGSSPYERTTFRYPPLVALLLIPNLWFHEFGKVKKTHIFAALFTTYRLVVILSRGSWSGLPMLRDLSTQMQ
jgi:hypothetical protein